jgi:hypothetical protein
MSRKFKIDELVEIVHTRYKGYSGRITFIDSRGTLKPYFVEIEDFGKGTYFYESDLKSKSINKDEDN